MATTGPPKTALDHFNLLAPHYEASTAGCTRELAQHIIKTHLTSLDASSHILDNACGNGIVAQELLFHLTNTPTASIPNITSVDGAPNMVEIARSSLSKTPPSFVSASEGEKSSKLHFGVMPGEKLDFEDNTFTHSITNMGIFFFTDGPAGAREIVRTLKPGGLAVVTSWAELGYIALVHAAQKKAKPDAPLFKVPVGEEWYDTAYLGKVMGEAGLKGVEVERKEVWYAAGSEEGLCALIGMLMRPLRMGFGKEEDEVFVRELKVEVAREAVKVERRVVGGREGEVEELVGIKMVALVAVGTK